MLIYILISTKKIDVSLALSKLDKVKSYSPCSRNYLFSLTGKYFALFS